MSKKGILKYEELLPYLRYITNKKDLESIKDAYDFAAFYHQGQFRQSGEPYVTHPLNVALILSSLEFDKDCLIAGLLHDVVEDTAATIEDVEKAFGKNVSQLIDNLSKIEPLKFKSKSEQLANYQRNLLVSLVKDPRIIIIKLCDRLHNMRTLNACSIEKQRRVATETLEIYTPLAHRLGIYNIKSELEDLSLRYTNPTMFYNIAEQLSSKKQEREENVATMISQVNDVLEKNNIKAYVKGRAKTIYSIYKKIEKGKRFSDIYDLLALRIVVETVGDCYICLGLIHDKYKLVPNRFKDYISRPKTNMYQSLHTAVFGPNGQIFEIQIRTKDMDVIAEDGIASHWSYKEGNSKKSSKYTDLKLQFFKSIIELDKDTADNIDFISSIKDDVLVDKSIYVYTPKGDVFELPIGATPIDFAYKIHTDIGNKMISAIVNGSIVSFDYILKTGDIIKINTASNATPNSTWVNIAVTSGAKNKIKNYFLKQNKEEILTSNKELLDKYLKENNINLKEFYLESNIKKLVKLFKLKDFDELLITLNSKNTPLVILNRYKEKIVKEVKKDVTITTKNSSNPNKAIIVSGIDDIEVIMASCCQPIPGDNIIGYVSSGKGIIIHKKSCHNSLSLEDKIVDVSWNSDYKGHFSTTLRIEMLASNKNLVNIINNMNSYNILLKNMRNISLKEPIIYELDLLVTNKEQLEKFINQIKKNKNIKNIERMNK